MRDPQIIQNNLYHQGSEFCFLAKFRSMPACASQRLLLAILILEVAVLYGVKHPLRWPRDLVRERMLTRNNNKNKGSYVAKKLSKDTSSFDTLTPRGPLELSLKIRVS